jgi:hypothetical protein
VRNPYGIELRKNKVFIPYQVHKEWVVKIPTTRHRLHKGGTIGLTVPEFMDLKEKRGVIYIDFTRKTILEFSREDLLANIAKKTSHFGLITVFNAKDLHARGLSKEYVFSNQEEKKHPIAEETLKKFGVTNE